MATITITFLTGYYWKEMLVDSGKDATLLGFNRYPAVLIVFVILLLTAFIMMVVSIIWIVKRNKNKV